MLGQDREVGLGRLEVSEELAGMVRNERMVVSLVGTILFNMFEF